MQLTTSSTSKKRPTVADRVVAVQALPVDDRSRLISAIRSHLKDRSPKVREAALQITLDELLSELDDQVHSLVFDKNDFVRQRAIECFGLFHEGEAIEAPWLYPFYKIKMS